MATFKSGRSGCSENMQQIYRRIPMPKCNFNKFAKQLYWNHTLAWVFSSKLAAYFQHTFLAASDPCFCWISNLKSNETVVFVQLDNQCIINRNNPTISNVLFRRKFVHFSMAVLKKYYYYCGSMLTELADMV